jgi:hypothetical protein
MVMSNVHQIPLLIQYRNGRALREMVRAERIGDETFRLLYSPGFVQGIAAGDEFKLLDRDGAFEVTHRAGNLAVQVLCRQLIGAWKVDLTRLLTALGGVFDGSIDKGLVFTIPRSVALVRIEEILNRFAQEHPDCAWGYGNMTSSDRRQTSAPRLRRSF